MPSGDFTVAATTEQIRICSPAGKQCIALDPKTGATTHTEYVEDKPRELSPAAAEARDGKRPECTAGTCKVAMIDDTHWAALGRDHTLFTFDGDKPQRIDIVPSVGYSDWEADRRDLTALPDKTIAVVLVRPKEATVVLVDAARGAVFQRWPLAICP